MYSLLVVFHNISLLFTCLSLSLSRVLLSSRYISSTSLSVKRGLHSIQVLSRSWYYFGRCCCASSSQSVSLAFSLQSILASFSSLLPFLLLSRFRSFCLSLSFSLSISLIQVRNLEKKAEKHNKSLLYLNLYSSCNNTSGTRSTSAHLTSAEVVRFDFSS